MGRRLRTVAGAGALALAALARTAPTFAEPRAADVVLHWAAPAPCPSEAAVRGELRALVSDSAAPGHVDANAHVLRVGERWHVDLAIHSEQGAGTRTFEAASCAELGSAVALIVALAFDPSRRPPPPATASTATDGGGSPLLVAPSATVPPADSLVAPPSTPGLPTASAGGAPGSVTSPPPAPRRASLRVVAAVGAAVDVGILPAAGAGAHVAAGVLFGRARLEARGAFFATQRPNDSARAGQGVALDQLAVGARVCDVPFAIGRVELGPCFGVGIEHLAGKGFGGAATFSRAATWGSVEAGMLVTALVAGPLAVGVGAELLVPFSRPNFVVLGPDGTVTGSLHRPAPVGGRFEASAELRFF